MNTINVTKRDLTVKAKKLRRNGYVPGSVFGGMLKEPVALQIEESVARQLVRELREGSRLKLNLDGTVIPVQIKEKSLDNLKHEILEISFQALAADQAVNSVIDIVLVNADKVTAVLEKLNMKIPYSALPADMILPGRCLFLFDLLQALPLYDNDALASGLFVLIVGQSPGIRYAIRYSENFISVSLIKI